MSRIFNNKQLEKDTGEGGLLVCFMRSNETITDYIPEISPEYRKRWTEAREYASLTTTEDDWDRYVQNELAGLNPRVSISIVKVGEWEEISPSTLIKQYDQHKMVEPAVYQNFQFELLRASNAIAAASRRAHGNVIYFNKDDDWFVSKIEHDFPMAMQRFTFIENSSVEPGHFLITYEGGHDFDVGFIVSPTRGIALNPNHKNFSRLIKIVEP